jgi:hypothetical protein
MNETGLVENAEALTRIFGYWPSFHDAEVHSLALDRSGHGGPSLTARVHVFEMTAEIDAQGHYVLRHHRLVTLRFANVALEELAGFNEQNALDTLTITEADPASSLGRRYEVVFDPAYGVAVRLFCDAVEVVGVEPYAPPAW